jgi:hypothetical protein
VDMASTGFRITGMELSVLSVMVIMLCCLARNEDIGRRERSKCGSLMKELERLKI